MSFEQYHTFTSDGLLHCPKTMTASRADPSEFDSHRYRCPSCQAVLVLHQRPVVTVVKELIEVKGAKTA